MGIEGLQIKEIRKRGNRVDAIIQQGEKVSEIFFECEGSVMVPSREALVAVTLFPAMKAGVALEVGGEVSNKMIDSLPIIQDVYHGWFPETYQHIEVKKAIHVERMDTKARRVGVFFSGGVDSWYTLISNQNIITDLILIWGFDIPLDKQALFNQTRDNVQKIADAFGKNLVVVKTDVRTFTQPLVDWNWMYGAGMAAIGHLLSSEFRCVYTSAGQWYAHLKPAASHILLDPRWSSESLEIKYVGLEASRLEKVREVAKHELALQTLRVCWRNPGDMYNCGWCEKCLRTMVALQIVGVLDRSPTFRGPINAKRLSQLRFLDENFLPYVEENVHALRKQPWNRKIYHAERRVLLRYYFKHFLFQVHSLYPRLLKRAGRFAKKQPVSRQGVSINHLDR